MLERVALASIREQASARRWRTFVRMAWLVFFAVMAWVLLQRGMPDAARTNGKPSRAAARPHATSNTERNNRAC